ncbi:MAG: SiaB family protein kinase [Cytophagales bacterium]|nr:SiaB family protein kinase [Cytophagales bacterium]MDW8383584.1 SiaB family protein kinase [Flammeovirgaceae bacterium]
MLEKLYEYYKKIPPETWYEDKNLAHSHVFFNGIITQNVIMCFTEKILKILNSSDEITNKLAFGIGVELSQNIQIHSVERALDKNDQRIHGKGILLCEKFPSFLVLSAGNVIKKETVKFLDDKCKFINHLNHEQLREYYNMERRQSLITKRKGGNVGLIDMAKKSGNPLNIHFHTIDEKYSFFALGVRINS